MPSQAALRSLRLDTKTAAALLGRSPSALCHARTDRPDILAPPARREGRRVYYRLGELLDWRERHGRHLRLRWGEVPLSFALRAGEAFERASLPAPEALLERSRPGRVAR